MKKLSKIFIAAITLLFLFQTTSKAYDPYVFITNNSAKYHLAGCDYMTSTPKKVYLSYAKASGYGPCKYCRPYMPTEIDYYDYTWIIIILAIVVFLIVMSVIIYLCSRRKKGKIYNKINNLIKQIKQKFKRKNKVNNYQNINTTNSYSPSIDVLKVNNIHQDENDKGKNENSTEKNKELTMKWYKFWNYVHLPSFVIVNFINSLILTLAGNGSSDTITELILSLYIIYVMSSLYNKRKNCFTHIKIILTFETIAWSIAITDSINPDFFLNLFIFIILLFVWFLPNYVYFNKRKDIFIN